MRHIVKGVLVFIIIISLVKIFGSWETENMKGDMSRGNESDKIEGINLNSSKSNIETMRLNSSKSNVSRSNLNSSKSNRTVIKSNITNNRQNVLDAFELDDESYDDYLLINHRVKSLNHSLSGRYDVHNPYQADPSNTVLKHDLRRDAMIRSRIKLPA